MKPTLEILQQFQLGQVTEFTKFVIYQSVTIASGSYRGRSGTIAHLTAIKPIARYLVEIGENEYADIDQTSLQPFRI